MSTRPSLGPTLKLIRGGRTERVYELKAPDLHIGRIPGLDVFLDDARVSRHHARVEHRSNGTFYLVDLDSKSRTQLDGQQLIPFQPVALSDGCRIQIVDFELVFHDGAVEMSETTGHDSTILQTLDTLSTEYLARRSIDPTKALKGVLEINRALGGGAELNDVLGRALDALMDVFLSAERGFILIAGADGRPSLRAIRQRTGPGQLPKLSRSFVHQVIDEGKAILIKDTSVDPRFMRSRRVASTFRSALCVPLPGHDGRPLGMVQLDKRTGTEGFKTADVDLLAALAVPVGVAVENHWLLKERASWAAAREIQVSLLPHDRPQVGGYAFWECYLPTLEVGGDLYDYIKVEPDPDPSSPDLPGRWAVTVGDVAGKGMPAALIVAGICPEVRHLVRDGVAPGDVMAKVNGHLFDRGVGGRFVTMVMAVIDPVEHQMTLVNAGHVDPLVRRASGAIETVGRSGAGIPLGVVPVAFYQPDSITLDPGDLVVLYTDGVTESTNQGRQEFGVDRLKEVLAAAPQGAAAAGEAILAAVREHAVGRSQSDDITIVCFERNPES